MKNFIRYLIIIVLLTATAGVCVATTPTIRRMLYYEFEVISFDNATGNASIAVTITPDRDTSLYVPKTVPEFCKEIPIQITTPDNLTFHSNQEMLLDFDGKENITIIVKVTLVEQSQVQLLFHATCTPTGKEITDYLFLKLDENKLSISRSSLTNAKKVVPLYQKPNWDTVTTEQLSVEYEVYFKIIDKESYQYFENITDTLIQTNKKDVYKTVLSLGELLELGKKNIEAEFVHRPPWDKRTTPWKNLEVEQAKLLAHKPKQTTQPIAPFTSADSLFYDSLTENGKKTYAKMKYLELQGPSTNRYGESALIDNYGFARDSGQTYFYRVRSVPTDKLRAESRRIRDSILAVNPPNVYDVIVDLRNSEDYLYFKDKVDLIEKTDREGYYRIECNKSVITEIEQRKIKYRRTHRPSWIKSDSAKAERRKRVEKVKKK